MRLYFGAGESYQNDSKLITRIQLTSKQKRLTRFNQKRAVRDTNLSRHSNKTKSRRTFVN